jgi:hypothetical protein
LLPVSISSNNTRIRCITLTARQPCIDALSDNDFEHMAQQITVTETTMSVFGKVE